MVTRADMRLTSLRRLLRSTLPAVEVLRQKLLTGWSVEVSMADNAAARDRGPPPGPGDPADPKEIPCPLLLAGSRALRPSRSPASPFSVPAAAPAGGRHSRRPPRRPPR